MGDISDRDEQLATRPAEESDALGKAQKWASF